MIMKRLTLLFLALAFCLGALTSCDLDRTGTYNYSNEFALRIEDKDDYKAVEEYMKANFVDIKDNPSFYGSNHDAIAAFTKHFVEELKRVDTDFIYSHLKETTDAVQLIGYATGKGSKEWVGFRTFTLADLEVEEAPQAQ